MPPFEYELGCTLNGDVQIDITKKRRFFGSTYHEVTVFDEVSGRTYKMKLDEPFEVLYDKPAQ